MDVPVEIISEPGKLGDVVGEIGKSGVIALDIESNSRHRYPEQLCLIQLAVPGKVYIIDPLAVKDISLLTEILLSRDIIKVFHEASNDLRSLDRHYKFRVRSIFDTAVAARFCGMEKHGLADVIREILGIDIAKSERLQRSDWGRRPLPEEALEYAAADVYHLVALGEVLIKRLSEMGRMAWVTEECLRLEDLRYEAPDPETFYRSVKGAGRLRSRDLAILRELYLFRENEALRRHKPPFYIMPDQALVYLASNPEADLSGVPGLGEKALKRLGSGIKQAVARGQAAPPVKRKHRSRPERGSQGGQQGPRLSRQQREKLLKILKGWREAIAAELSLEPSLIWPLVSLRRLAENPDSLEAELLSGDVREWQGEKFSLSLAGILGDFE